MVKINVPQEQQKQIIELYVNDNYNRKQIKKELNLPYSDSVIKRVLIENNITIKTNNGALHGGRKKIQVDQEIQNKIIKMYNEGYGLNHIVKELNLPFSSDKVKSILKDNDIYIRNLKESVENKKYKDSRKYSINDDYSFETHNGAWLLGFIAADGYLPITNGAKNRVVISVADKDKNILELIKKELEYTGPIYNYISSNGFPFSSLSFTSKKIRKKIESYGIVNNKTFILKKLPDIPKQYMIDFIAGFFDGDGSIYEPADYHKIKMNITCASHTFLEEIIDFLFQEYNIPKPSVRETIRKHIIYYIVYNVKASFILGDLFYNNNYLRLPRKKEKFLHIKNKYY